MKANRRFAFFAAWREMSPFRAKFAMPLRVCSITITSTSTSTSTSTKERHRTS
jgi:hypothetical protein